MDISNLYLFKSFFFHRYYSVFQQFTKRVFRDSSESSLFNMGLLYNRQISTMISCKSIAAFQNPSKKKKQETRISFSPPPPCLLCFSNAEVAQDSKFLFLFRYKRKKNKSSHILALLNRSHTLFFNYIQFSERQFSLHIKRRGRVTVFQNIYIQSILLRQQNHNFEGNPGCPARSDLRKAGAHTEKSSLAYHFFSCGQG